MDQLIETFHIDWHIMLAQAINFVIVFVVLYLFAFKPLGKIMQKRSEEIAQGLNDAKTNKDLLENTQKVYDETLIKARSEANQVLSEMKKEVDQKKNKMLEDAKNEVAKTLEQGREQLQNEKAKIINEAKKEVADLVIEATKKILADSISIDVDKKIIENSIK